jgi:serine/threonine protein kinase
MMAKGTLRWTAPELLQPKAQANYASDVYSLGMVLWEIGSGCLPFEKAANEMIVMGWLQQGTKEDLPVKLSDCEEEDLTGICCKCDNGSSTFNPQQGKEYCEEHGWPLEYIKVIEGCWKAPSIRLSVEAGVQNLQRLVKSDIVKVESQTQQQKAPVSKWNTLGTTSFEAFIDNFSAPSTTSTTSGTTPTASATNISNTSTADKTVAKPEMSSTVTVSPTSTTTVTNASDTTHRDMKNLEWYACGWSQSGQLGLGHNQPEVLSWTRVSFPVPFVSIACGWRHTLALDEKGEVWSWGYNADGQLGLGHNNSFNAPKKVFFFLFTQLDPIVMISAGSHHSVALTKMQEALASMILFLSIYLYE